MATPSAALGFDRLRREINGRQLAPVYLFHGEEGFFIDELLKAVEGALPEADREFNLYTMYATESSAAAVVARSQGYPMMADRQIVIVKEAQGWGADDWETIAAYAARPVPTTVLAIASRGKTIKSKALTTALTACHGVDFESKKLKDTAVMPVVEQLVKARGLNIEPKGLEMLCDYVGGDISRIYNQVEKLVVALEAGATVTPEAIERNIGISKEYNTFELRDAIFARDMGRALRIVEYFRANPKNNPAVPVPATIFSGFAELLVYQFMRDKSPSAVMSALGLKWSGQVARIEKAARGFNARQTIDIIAALRDADRKMKGVGSRQDSYDILRDLVYYILTTRGI